LIRSGLRKTAGEKARIAIAAISLLILVAGTIGCGGAKAPAAPNGTTPAASKPAASGAKTTSTPRAAGQVVGTSSSKATAPKLTDVAFTLALETGQEYTENTTPIYLKASQILHLNWLVVKGGDHFYLTFTLPTGNLMSINGNGTLSPCNPGARSTDPLTKNGDVVFSPQDNNWGDGYYLFHPQIYKPDVSVTVKLLYWIE
jgi:hypothetical protein